MMIQSLYLFHLFLVSSIIIRVLHKMVLYETSNFWLMIFTKCLLTLWLYQSSLRLLQPFQILGVLLIIIIYLLLVSPLSIRNFRQVSYVINSLSLLIIIGQLFNMFYTYVLPNTITGKPTLFLLLVIASDFLWLLLTRFLARSLRFIHDKMLSIKALITFIISVLILIIAWLWLEPLRYSSFIVMSFSYNTVQFYQLLLALVVIGLIITFIVIRQRQRYSQKQLMSDIYQYNQSIEQLYSEVIMFRHDYLNILHSLRLSIDQEDWSGVRQVFDETVAPTQKILHSQSFDLGKLRHIHILELKSLLYSKLLLAEAEGISVQLELNQTIKAMPINTTLLIRIVSILLDNAIQAALNSNRKKIGINIFFADDCYHIQIHNTYENLGTLLENKKMTNLTKQNGWGLHFVKEIIKTNEHLHLITDITEAYVSQRFSISHKPER